MISRNTLTNEIDHSQWSRICAIGCTPAAIRSVVFETKWRGIRPGNHTQHHPRQIARWRLKVLVLPVILLLAGRGLRREFVTSDEN
jgi:hypothetical protein